MIGPHPVSDVVIRTDPEDVRSALIFDSPHSGRRYPSDFMFSCPELILRQAEDSFVDDLFAGVTVHGATLVAAQFPRSYIDVNRAIDDIDPQLLASPWPSPIRPTEKSRVGMGLVRRICKPGLPVYSRRLTVREVQSRIEQYYLPYHAEVRRTIDDVWAQFGGAWHINCHSMPSSSVAAASHGGWDRADFVLGDRDGTTCSPEFCRFVRACLERMGYSVRLNDPYKGVEIVRRYGNPGRGIHSLQLEINRKLYLDEERVEPTRDFAVLKRDLTSLAGFLRAYVDDQLVSAAAD